MLVRPLLLFHIAVQLSSALKCPSISKTKLDFGSGNYGDETEYAHSMTRIISIFTAYKEADSMTCRDACKTEFHRDKDSGYNSIIEAGCGHSRHHTSNCTGGYGCSCSADNCNDYHNYICTTPVNNLKEEFKSNSRDGGDPDPRAVKAILCGPTSVPPIDCLRFNVTHPINLTDGHIPSVYSNEQSKYYAELLKDGVRKSDYEMTHFKGSYIQSGYKCDGYCETGFENGTVYGRCRTDWERFRKHSMACTNSTSCTCSYNACNDFVLALCGDRYYDRPARERGKAADMRTIYDLLKRPEEAHDYICLGGKSYSEKFTNSTIKWPKKPLPLFHKSVANNRIMLIILSVVIRKLYLLL